MGQGSERIATELLRAEARQLFDAGDFIAAKHALLRTERQELLDDAELELLVDLLRDATEEEAALVVLDRNFKRMRTENIGISPSLAAIYFDLTIRLNRDEITRRDAATDLLRALVETGDESLWNAIFTAARQAAVEGAFNDSIALLDALVQEAMAPESTGISIQAKSRIEEIGSRNAQTPEVARSAERMLHALGDARAAYRVERERKRAWPESIQSVAEPKIPSVSGLTIGLAGGYPAIRAMIERDLLSLGAGDVRSIPSAKEATRSGRDIRAMLSGCDVVVLLVRQLAHSTDAQIKRAAAHTGIPVIVAESSGIGGVQRALRAFVDRNR